MYSKIAIKNVKKSFKDYSIYFLTLTLAVCIFYSFNSIESQKVLIDMNSSGAGYIHALSGVISFISVFVAFILGGLILYANNFLIKKRNKELGIYMTLGMGKSNISKMLVYETILVGVVSLISGLIFGVIVSQGLSILVSKLFDVAMSEYQFVISFSAMIKTTIYFSVMFILVMIFNTYVISKYKIIDLLVLGRKTEQIKFKNAFVYLFTFLLCVLSLGSAYALILKVGIKPSNPMFMASIIFGVIGTFLFFYSLSGFVLYIVKKNKSVYFKGLNIFLVKQINSKVNTNFISMTVICLMLFLTIGILSTGFSFKSGIDAGLEGATPYDASAYIFVSKDDKIKSIKESFKITGVKFNKNDKVVYYDEYANGSNISDIIPLNSKNVDYGLRYIKSSDYNNLRKLEDKKPIDLKKNEVLITCNSTTVLPVLEKYMKENNTIKLKDIVYNIKNNKVIEDNLKTDILKNNIITIVVDDNLTKNMYVTSSIVNVNFDKANNLESQKKFDKVIESKYMAKDVDYDKTGFVLSSSRDSVYESNKGMTTTVLFVGIYLGIVFLISSMAVLALQQLSEASDSIDRYVALSKIGATRKSISKNIFMQTLIYFSIPIILALVHSIVGIKVANDFISIYNQPDIGTSSLITAGILIVVYGVYFYTTYQGYKSIVMNKIR